MHVADREEVNQRRNTGDEKHHRDRQRVHQKRNINAQGRQPGPEHFGKGALIFRFRREREEHRSGGQKRQTDHCGAEIPSKRFADPFANEQQDSEPDQREKWDKPNEIKHGRDSSSSEQVGTVGRGTGFSATENGHDYSKTNHNFGCGYHHREENSNLSTDVVQHLGKSNEREVHGIQHELHAHKHHDYVAAKQ